MTFAKHVDHTCEFKTFRKYKQAQHGQTMVLTSNNALRARHHFFTTEICIFLSNNTSWSYCIELKNISGIIATSSVHDVSGEISVQN